MAVEMTVYGKPGKRPKRRRNTEPMPRAFPGLPTDLGNRPNRFPHSHRRDSEKSMKSSAQGAIGAARPNPTVQAHFWIGKDWGAGLAGVEIFPRVKPFTGDAAP
jgi:hypothetical protein